MPPEISRRCLGCGASVRAGARFCPQCGAKFDGDVDTGSATPGTDTLLEPPAATTLNVAGEAMADMGGFLEKKWAEFESGIRKPVAHESREVVAGSEVESVPEAGRERFAAPPLSREVDAPLSHTDAAVALESLNATSAPAAGQSLLPVAATTPPTVSPLDASPNVGEDVRPRVEKTREVSSFVSEEAAEDSGLRFVLIAAVLFLLFLLFLFLSTVIK